MRLNALLPLALMAFTAPALQAEELPKAIEQLQAKGADPRRLREFVEHGRG